MRKKGAAALPAAETCRNDRGCENFLSEDPDCKEEFRKEVPGNASRSRTSAQGIPMKNEIQLVASFGIMLIMMLSNFGLCGVVGVWLSSFFFGIFGCVQYVMPLAFFLMVTVLLANDYSSLP